MVFRYLQSPHYAIVAGAGIWGCTVARRLAEAGRKVLVLEKRAAVGGNCRCETESLAAEKTIIMREYPKTWVIRKFLRNTGKNQTLRP